MGEMRISNNMNDKNGRVNASDILREKVASHESQTKRQWDSNSNQRKVRRTLAIHTNRFRQTDLCVRYRRCLVVRGLPMMPLIVVVLVSCSVLSI